MSKEIEKEVRYQINEDTINKIIKSCQLVKEEYHTVDIVLGYAGFDSLDKYGYIVRIRDKGNKLFMENKRRLQDGSWQESRVDIPNIETGLNFLMNMGYKPYLLISRKRAEYIYNDLKVFIDRIELLGDYIEIEYQDSSLEKVNDFINIFSIKGMPQPLYGDIFKEKVKNTQFRESFEEELRKFTK